MAFRAGTVGTIEAGEGNSQRAAHSIPTGSLGFINNLEFAVDSGKTADISLRVLEGASDVAGTVAAERILIEDDGIDGGKFFEINYDVPAEVEIGAPLWLESWCGVL